MAICSEKICGWTKFDLAPIWDGLNPHSNWCRSDPIGVDFVTIFHIAGDANPGRINPDVTFMGEGVPL